MQISFEEAHATYQVLIEECGALPDADSRARFVEYMTDDDIDFREWRFMGALGFGGKCRINSNHAYPRVDYYSEDVTPARERMAANANARLAEIFSANESRQEPTK